MPVVLTNDSQRKPHEHAEPLPARLTGLVAVFGLMLLVASVVDIGLLWFPFRLSDADWEFGVIAQSLDAMPLLTMSLLLLAVAILVRGNRRLALALTAALALVTLWLVGSLVLFALDVPQALAAMRNATQLAPGLKRVIFKAAILFVGYLAGYASATVLLWRRTRRLPA